MSVISEKEGSRLVCMDTLNLTSLQIEKLGILFGKPICIILLGNKPVQGTGNQVDL